MTLFNNKYRVESIRMQNWDYSSPGIYFITICTDGGVHWFGRVEDGKMILSDIGKYVREEWINTGKMRPNIILDSYIIMPDHIHGIIIIKNDENVNVETHCNASLHDHGLKNMYKNKFGPQRNNLSSIIRGFKSKTTKYIRINYNPKFKWQSGFYDRIIHNNKQLSNTRNYIKNNPKNWKRGNKSD